MFQPKFGMVRPITEQKFSNAADFHYSKNLNEFDGTKINRVQRVPVSKMNQVVKN